MNQTSAIRINLLLPLIYDLLTVIFLFLIINLQPFNGDVIIPNNQYENTDICSLTGRRHVAVIE
jgi:hypothetical protein